MIKKVFVLNGVGTVGKGEFVGFVQKYIPTLKYSIIDLPKQAAEILGWDGGKTERDRKFLSDLMDLASEYNDSPYNDVESLVIDFYQDDIDFSVLIIDMRDPADIARAAKNFNAETILMRNPSVSSIITNHADANVENYDGYDYIIVNDGTLEQLDLVAKMFVCDVICENHIPNSSKPFVFTCSKY